jgi:hypothetical protein
MKEKKSVVVRAVKDELDLYRWLLDSVKGEGYGFTISWLNNDRCSIDVKNRLLSLECFSEVKASLIKMFESIVKEKERELKSL